MSLIRPFRGLRPAPGRAGEVAAPPYDVLSSDEARQIVHGAGAGKPWSFLVSESLMVGFSGGLRQTVYWVESYGFTWLL